MNKYEGIYSNTPSEADIAVVKKELYDNPSSTSWEDYYWGAKCISEYDKDDFNPTLLSSILNNSLKYGLTYRLNQEYYLDVIKKLAGVYSLLGRYELTLNCLNSVLELDDNAPDWVFHDLVSAQNRTRAIKRNLKNPKMFLADLSRNDENSLEVKRKQTNIFKEFLAAGVVYLSDNPTAEVGMDAIKEAAIGYGLADSSEWTTFVNATNGNFSSEIKEVIKNEIKPDTAIKTEPAKQEEVKRPLVISLFPEPEETTQDTKYEDLLKKLEKMQAELDQKNEELKKAGSTVEQLTQANRELQASVEKFNNDISEYDNELEEKRKEIKELEQALVSASGDSSEKKVLEERIAVAQDEKSKLTEQIAAVKDALKESEEKLQSTGEQLKNSIEENRSLKAKLDSTGAESQIFADYKAAVILGKCKTFEYITAKKLARWLHKYLKNFNDWWERRVICNLSNDQALRAQDGHYTSLEEFDLAALLRICSRNWNLFKQYIFLADSEWQCMSDMFDVRNGIAHFNVAPMQKDVVVGYLQTMSEFLVILNANTESKEVEKYAREVSKMELD
ncbi:Swt1 family HEPN domain-containing protein [Butyrivibrio sp. AE3009]|uniref:Swt1 family HEPN domain-containing protein n=1 Tax=Butyrivibrio sp. AE3009 TaxID=1280666 RepID=UPI0003B2EA94|nr:Swt1 family HEPN domain-containing protein [Butyrivibrio sp. AE3009]